MGEEELLPPPPKQNATTVSVGEGELLPPPPKKKSEPTPEEKGVQSTNGSATVSEQQSKSGAKDKIPTTYEWSSGGQQNYGITTPTEKEQRKVVSKNVVSDYHEKLEKNNDVYSKAQNNSDIVSIVDYYPFYNDVKRINQRLTEIGEPKTKEQIQEHNKLVEEYNAIRNKPISEYEQPQEGNTIDIADKNGNTTKMQLIKDMGVFRKELRTSKSELKNAKTVGELLDAQGQAITNFNALVPEMKVASEDLNNTIKEYQKSAGYTDKDMGFWESFSHSAIRSLDNMRLYAMSEGEQASEIKRMELEDELTPKEASGVLGSIGEISGGLAPYITLGALTGNIGGWTGVLATSLSQGLAGGTEAGGRSLYDTYRELKANGVNEQEALRVAHKVANFNAAASGMAFGTIGLFGGEGLGDVASKAMYEGFGGEVAKKTAIKSVIGKLKDQSIAPIIFGANRTMQNLYSNYEGIHRDLDEGVIQDMMFPVALHASMAALAGGAKFVGKAGKEAYNTYTTFVAKSNPQSLQYILNEAVKNGVIDEAHAQKVATDVQNKAEIIAQMPQMPFDKLQEGIPAMQNWLNAKRQLDKAKEDGSPFLPQAEALEKEAARKVQETLGTPLSPKEQKAYEELSARKKESQVNKEAQGLSSSEKEELAHYEDRITHADRVENIPQEKPFRVKSKNGETGLLIKNEDGDMEFIPDGNKPSRVFERNEATPKKTIQELGFTRVGEETIEKPKSQILTGEVKEGADVLFGGRRYTLTGVVKDADGKITKVRLRHKNGDKRTISDRSAEGKKLISDANKMIGKAAKEESIKRQQEEEAAKLQEQKTEANDKENITGLPSEVGGRQEPIETQPIEEGGGGKVEGGGVLEKTQEVAPAETVSVDKQSIVSNTKKEIDRVVASEPNENGDGQTFNLDGTVHSEGGLVIPIVSENLKVSELTPERVADFIEANKDKLGGNSVKVGIYKFPNGEDVSIDLNVVAPREMREEAIAFGNEAGQESLFDLDTFENVKTGADGKNPKQFTAQEFKDIAKRFSEKPKEESQESTRQRAITDVVVKRISRAINKPINVLSKSDFAKALSEAMKGSKAKLQAWGGYVKNGFEETQDFKDLVKSGQVELHYDILNLANKDVFIISPDNMMVGSVIDPKTGNTMVEGMGGVNYVLKTGKVWAHSNSAKSSNMIKWINNQIEKNGVAHIVLTKGTESKLLNTHVGARGGMHVIENLVDKGLISVGDFRKALIRAGKSYGLEFNATGDLKTIHEEVKKQFYDKIDSTFPMRGKFIHDLIVETIVNSRKSKRFDWDGIKKELNIGEGTFKTPDIKNAIGILFADEMTIKGNVGDAYAVIEIKSKVKEETNKNEHVAYPSTVVTTDGSKPRLLVMDAPRYIGDVSNDQFGKEVKPYKDASGAIKPPHMNLGSGNTGFAYGKIKPNLGQVRMMAKAKSDHISGTYYEPHMTETKDGKNYVFFHVSGADEKSIRQGIDSRRYQSLRTAREEKGLQYGVASYYTKVGDGERMVGGEKYAVVVPKDKVYPMDTDPNGYRAKAEKKIPEGTPFRKAQVDKAMAEMAKKDGYQMAVGEWYYDRAIGESGDNPAMRADALVTLKPEKQIGEYKTSDKKIPHPEQQKIQSERELESFLNDARLNRKKGQKYSEANSLAENYRIYGGIPTEQEFKKMMEGLPPSLIKRGEKLAEAMFHAVESGDVYGFEYNGQIFLNEAKMNPNTPIHEAGHIWTDWAEKERPDLFEHGMNKVEGSEYLNDVMNNKVYQEQAKDMTEADRKAFFKKEALAKAIGDNGERFATENERTSFKQWVMQMWRDVISHFGIKDATPEDLSKMTIDEFSKKIAADIFKGEEPVKELQKTATSEQTVFAPKENELAKEGGDMVGKTVTFEHAGSEKSGVVKGVDAKGNLEVEGVGANKGVKYTVKAKDVSVSESAAQQKHYEEISASKPNNQTGRTPIDPIIGGSPKKISDIVFDVSKALKQKVFYAKTKRGATGTYTPSNKGIKIRYDGDLDVTAHELGHSIDDMFGVISDLQQTPNQAVESELLKYSPFGSKPPQNHPNPRMYELGEGFAEWLRAYIVNPKQAIIDAPETYKLFESRVDADYKKSIKDFSDDIRTFAGASGRDMTLANIDIEPSKGVGIWKKIFGDKNGSDQFEVTWVDKLAANFTNPLTAFNKAFEYAKGLKGIDEVLPSDDPRILVRLLSGFDGKYGSVLQDGMINGEGKVILDANGKAKNLSWLLEPLDNTDESTIKNDMKDVISYMVAERTVELAKKFGRESGLTGIGGGIYKDIDVAQKTLDEFNNGDPNKLSRIKDASSRYREMADDVLKYMVEKGRLAQRVEDTDGNLVGGYDFIKQNNMQYVGLQRVIESEPNKEVDVNFGKGGKLGSASEPIKAIQGSSKKISNPYISLIDTIYKGMKEADRNEVLMAFRDMIYEPRQMYQGEPKRFSDVGVLGKEGDKNSVTIFIDGKPEHWILQDDVYKAIKGLDETGFKFPSVITAFPKALRWTVTHFPVFAVRNIVRDFQDRIIKSTEGSGVKELIGDKEHWKELARSGGLNGGYYLRDRESYYGLLEEAMHDMAKNKKFILADPIKFKENWRAYTDLLTKSETVNRVAEYRAAYKIAKSKGMNDYDASLYAGYKSRDLMDFALIGNQMKWINQIIPFSNAAVQGLRKTAAVAKENPAGFGARLLAYSIAPSVLAWLYNHKDKESAEEYESLPAYQRDMCYNFKIGADTWLVIPKPYELSLPGASVDRIMSKMYGNTDAFKGYGGTILKSSLPVDQANLIPVAPAAVEGMMNYDLFRDKSVIPPYENNLDLALRHTENASRLGKVLQETSSLAGYPIDARKIDHFIKGQFSYFGKTSTELSNIGSDNGKDKFSIQDFGFFKGTPAYNSPQVQEFMEYADRAGLGRSTDVKDFNKLAQRYFNETNRKRKDELAKTLRDYADKTLKKWVSENRLQEKIDKKLSSQTPSSPTLPTLGVRK